MMEASIIELRDQGYLSGSYNSRCIRCRETYDGHKHSSVCKTCAEKWVKYNRESKISWTHKGSVMKTIEDFPDGCIGFVYSVYNTKTHKTYIGKKILRTKRTRKPLKGYKRKRVDYIESNWLTYKGSSEITKEWDMKDCVREILYLCTRKDEMTFYETAAIFEFGFENEKLVNSNVLGKFYKKTVQEKFGKLVY